MRISDLEEIYLSEKVIYEGNNILIYLISWRKRVPLEKKQQNNGKFLGQILLVLFFNDFTVKKEGENLII